MQDCHAGVFQVIPRSLCLVNRSRLHRPALPVLTAAPPPPAAPFPTVLLRGANDYMLDEMDRSLHDAFCIVKRVLENEQVVAGARGVLWCLVWWCWVGAIRGASGCTLARAGCPKDGAGEVAVHAGCGRAVAKLARARPPSQLLSITQLTAVSALLLYPICCAGGGAVETALSVYLESFATTLGSREQMAIAEFADALLVIPKTLAVNAAKVGGWGGMLCMWCSAGSRLGTGAAMSGVPDVQGKCAGISQRLACIVNLQWHGQPHPPTHSPTHSPQDATELVAKLRAHHYTAQTKPGQEQLCRVGAGCKSGRGLRGWDVGALLVRRLLAVLDVAAPVCCFHGLPLLNAVPALQNVSFRLRWGWT